MTKPTTTISPNYLKATFLAGDRFAIFADLRNGSGAWALIDEGGRAVWGYATAASLRNFVRLYRNCGYTPTIPACIPSLDRTDLADRISRRLGHAFQMSPDGSLVSDVPAPRSFISSGPRLGAGRMLG